MNIWIFDFETSEFQEYRNDDYVLSSRFCCFIEIFTNERKFFNIEQNGNKEIIKFLKSLIHINKPNRLYAHNLNFDIAFLYDLLPQNSNYEIIYQGSRLLDFKIFKEYERTYKDKIRIERKTLLDIRNSFSLFPTSLKELGKSIDLPKLQQSYVSEINQEYIDYCFRDCEIVQKALFELIKEIKESHDYEIQIQKLPLTFPATCKKILHFMLEKQYGKQIFYYLYQFLTEQQEQYFRPYFFGGRVEVYNFNTCFHGFYNDFNSWYPFHMKNTLFPIGKITEIKCFSQKEYHELLYNDSHYFGMECLIIENQEFPLIPIKHKNGKILFANGSKTSFIFRQEYEYLLKLKQKVKIIKLFKCQVLIDLFSKYIDIAYYHKQHSKDFKRNSNKRKMNTVFGKFSETSLKETRLIINDIFSFFDDTLEINDNVDIIENSDNTITFMKSELKEIDVKANILVSMLITALGRLGLHENILKATKCYYSDTDSLVSSEMIENSNELGHLKPEFSFTRFQALGCKEYIYEKLPHVDYHSGSLIPFIHFNEINYKMKGFGKKGKYTFNSFLASYFNPKKQHRQVGFFESFKMKLDKKTMRVFEKFKNNVYDKRWILDDFTTKPFNLDNENFNDLIVNNTKQIKKLIFFKKLNKFFELLFIFIYK